MIKGRFHDIGTISNCNKYVTDLLQYSATDLQGQNVSSIMPKVYMESHDHIVMSYLEEKNAQINDKAFLVLPQNKDGYIIPCKLRLKILPNLDDGIQIIGMLKPIKKLKSFNPSIRIIADIPLTYVGIIIYINIHLFIILYILLFIFYFIFLLFVHFYFIL